MTGKKNRLKKSINLNNDKNHNPEQRETSSGFSEEIHRIVTDNAFDMILMLDLNGSYLFSNNSVEENLGYSQDELLGRSAFDFIHPDDREEMIRTLQEGLAENNKYARFLIRIVHRNGSYRWIDHKAKLITPSGEQSKILINAQDLTDRLESDGALADSREWYRTIAEDIPALVTRISPDYVFTFANNAYCAFMGKSAEKITGDNLSVYIPPDNYNKVINHLSSLTPERPINSHEHTNTRHDGSDRWIRWANRAFFDPEGRVKEYLCIGEDITGYIEAFQLLKESEALKSTIVEAIPDTIIRFDKEGRYLDVLSGDDAMLYLPRKKILGKTIKEILPEKLAILLNKAINEAIVTGELQTLEYLLEKSNGTFEREARIKSTGDNEVIAFIRDITEKKHFERELSASEQKYRDILASIEEGYYEADLAGNITFCNDATLRMLGYTKDGFIGMSYKKIYKDPETVYRTYNRVFRSGNPDRGFTLEMLRKDGSSVYGELSVTLIMEKDGNAKGFRGVARDITDRIIFENKLKYLSLHDQLTGLNNRAYFEEEVARLSNSREYPITMILTDLDDLKFVNDSLGHAAGDNLLKVAAEILKNSVRSGDILARVGGDEFIAILPKTDQQTGEVVAARIRNNVIRYNDENVKFPLGLSIGLATAEDQKYSLKDIFKQADDYMYQDKLSRSNRVRSKTVEALLVALAERDYITEGHAQRLSDLCRQVGEKINLSSRQLSDLALLAQVHDLGKVGIPDNILFKKGVLTDEEWKTMRLHPEKGYRIAMTTSDLSGIADLILKHHERWDGNGYPLELKEEEIPIECRILAIIDAYDAMTNNRPYSKAVSNQEALDEIKRNAGKQFDPKLSEIFLSLLRKR